MRSILVPSLLATGLLVSGFSVETQAQPKKMATVSLGNLSQTYNGFARSVTATTSAPGLPRFKITYNGSSFAPTAAGRYTVVCTLDNDRYEGRATGTLVINKARATISLSDLTQTYNGSPRPVKVTSSSTGINSFEVTYSGSSTPPTRAGSYSVFAKLKNDNYEGNTTGILVIAKATSTTALNFSPAKPAVGQTITLTARVASGSNGGVPTGTITFRDGDKTLETVNLLNETGGATSTFSLKLVAGKRAFSAVYSGDANFTPSTSAIISP